MADALPWPNFSLLHYYFTVLCPIIIGHLLSMLPMILRELLHFHVVVQNTSLLRHLQAIRSYPPPRKKKKPKWLRERVPRLSPLTMFAAAWFIYKMGCHVEIFYHQTQRMLINLCGPSHCHQAFAGANAVHFDSDSYIIGVDGHASYCMGNHPDQFDGDLQLLDDGKTVSGIGSGIAIEGIGTFKFAIEDDTGQAHVIRIPNSLYVPSLKRVLLAPQHWAQEARDHQLQW